jgi:protein arginine kinase activator
MLCQDCHKREARVKLTQIINNEKTTLQLCNECAAARGFHSPLDKKPFPLAEILNNLAAKPMALAKKETGKTITCQSCGLTFEDFKQLGRFGCGQCYRSFRSELEPIMRKIHGASLHLGRTPKALIDDGGDAVIPVKEEERLETELKKAIASEDYERAAELRDKLSTIRQ